MPQALPAADRATPYLAHHPDRIERFLAAADRPLDTACGMLATDPALLLHLLARLPQEPPPPLQGYALRRLAEGWIESAEHRWYAVLAPLEQSPLDDEQRRAHQRLGGRAAFAAGLIGEWSCDNLPALERDAELAETQAVLAVLPSLVRLCRVGGGEVYGNVVAERAAWSEELEPVLGEQRAALLCPPRAPEHPVAVAVEMAAVALGDDRLAALEQLLPAWASRLQRPVEQLREDLARIEGGLQLGEEAPAPLDPAARVALVQGERDPELRTPECEHCRRQEVDNALATLRARLDEPGFGFGEMLDHLMHALSQSGALRRVQWLALEDGRLGGRRRKLAVGASAMPAWRLRVDDAPLLQVLLERPRSVQIYPAVHESLRALLSDARELPFAEHYLCASVFCGSTPLGVLYADGAGAALGAAEAARFKAMAQLATKLSTLLALREQRLEQSFEPAHLAYPGYAAVAAANESGEQAWQGRLLGELKSVLGRR